MQALPESFTLTAGRSTLHLPVVPLGDDLAIALFMTVDHGVAFMQAAGEDIARLVADLEPEIVVSAATLGIPVAIEVTRALGLDDYLILQKTPKIHLADALAADLDSLTTDRPQRLMLDARRQHVVAGRRVLLVDDVISTGGSIAAALSLLDRASAEVVGIATVLSEGTAWRDAVGDRAELVRSLASIPLFRRGADGWIEEWS